LRIILTPESAFGSGQTESGQALCTRGAADPLPPGVPHRGRTSGHGVEYREEQAEIRRQEQAGELRDLSADDPFPPTRYGDEE
jgi:hypothetical protein